MNPLIDPSRRLVVAHRGASADAPENTLAAFALAQEQGADAVELDVRVTADGVPVICHDPDTRRIAERTLVIAQSHAAAVQALDAGWGFGADPDFPWRGRGLTVPTLAEVLTQGPPLPLLLEVKEPAGQEHVAETLRRHAAAERVLVASAHHSALAAFRDGPFLVGASRRDIARLYFGRSVGWAPRRVEYRALSVPERFGGLPVPTRRFVRAARRLGAAVHVWTVDDPVQAQALWRVGVAGVVSNRPGLLVQARADLA